MYNRNRCHLLALLIALSACVSAQNFTGGFNFYLPPTDTAQSAFLPYFPAKLITDQDFISIDVEGHFSTSGDKIRFFGTNFTADAAFPAKSKAWYIAGRLRKMGFNLVRLQALDNNWGPKQSLFEFGKNTRHFDAEMLDKLENLVAQFKKNGIYVNIPLYAYRKFNILDNVPDSDPLDWNVKRFPISLVVNYFDPQILSLNKEYAKQLLTHINPYTGKSLLDDPVLALVEITNENSLYREWQLNNLKTFEEGGNLISRHSKMLDDLWMAFLKTKYPSTASLQLAWANGTHFSPTSEKIKDGGFENLNSKNWTIGQYGNYPAILEYDASNAVEGKYSAKVNVVKTDGVNWHLQLVQSGLSIAKDSVSQITIWAKSDSTRTIRVNIDNTSGDYKWYGSMSLPLTTQWKKYSFSLKARETDMNNVRIAFNLGSQKGIYWFDNISFNGNIQGLLAGESIEANTVRRIDAAECPGYSDQRVKDMTSFYLQLEEKYFSSMKSFLNDTLGLKVPITGTGWNIDAADCAGQSSMDYMDNHAYWDHPAWPSEPWSFTDWTIQNKPMVKSEGGTIVDLMGGTAMLNKPYTISEYNNVFPNRYQTEGLLFLTSYASFQDVDGFMLFNYKGPRRDSKDQIDDWEIDRISSGFDLQRNTAMMSLMPSCALAYRRGLIGKYKELVTVQYHPNTLLLLPKFDFNQWGGIQLYSPKMSLTHGVRTASYNAETTTDFSSLPADPMSPYITDTKELVWDTQGLFTVSASGFNAATGFLNSFPNHSFGAMTLKSGNDFGTISWISLDADSLLHAKKSLITLASRTQNSNMLWDGINTFHNNWGGAPTQLQPLTVELNLRMKADYIIVRPLDSTGNPSSAGKTYFPSSPNTFAVTIDQKTDNTVWFGVDAFGNGTTSINDHPISTDAVSLQNYPNPFKSSTTFSFDLNIKSSVSLKILDVTGKEVETIVSEELPSGHYMWQWKADNFPHGIYFYRFQTGSFSQTGKLILL